MSAENHGNQCDPPDDSNIYKEGLHLEPRTMDDLLAINWRLVLLTEQGYEEQRILMQQFNEELDALFAMIDSPETATDESSSGVDPPDWPNL